MEKVVEPPKLANTYYICQALDGWWMVGMEYKDESNRRCIGRCQGMEEPLASLTCFDPIMLNTIICKDKTEIFMDGRSTMFPSKDALVKSLNRVGLDEGEALAYNCRKIVAYKVEKKRFSPLLEEESKVVSKTARKVSKDKVKTNKKTTKEKEVA